MIEEPVWNKMSDAPQDGRTIIAKRKAAPRGTQRKYEIIKIGRSKSLRFWNNRTVPGSYLHDDDLVGWVPACRDALLFYWINIPNPAVKNRQPSPV